jgi:putative DNA modification/repair radical SAM protein
MELVSKLSILASGARYDASCASSGSDRASVQGGACTPAGICHSWTGDGRCISLLKVLYSNSCRFDCAYCPNRASADIVRTAFSADELVRITKDFYRRNYIEGLFLSSGIFADPDMVMERMTEVARRLRRDEGFGGYIHLKAIPGSGDRALREAGLWADRLSANIELPTAGSLAVLAPQKDGRQILDAMRYISGEIAESESSIRRTRRPSPFAPAGQSTQIIVGASPEPDRTVLRLSSGLYGKLGLRRVYYSAFVPVNRDPRLPTATPPLLREHRLYQADWLLRFYGFTVDELVDDSAPNLDPALDPKSAWALRHPEFFPVDLAYADCERILRVPGIGTTGAARILETRRAGGLSLAALPRLGIAMKRARYFITVRGASPEGFAGRRGTEIDLERLRTLLAAPAGLPTAEVGRAPQLEFAF